MQYVHAHTVKELYPHNCDRLYKQSVVLAVPCLSRGSAYNYTKCPCTFFHADRWGHSWQVLEFELETRIDWLSNHITKQNSCTQRSKVRMSGCSLKAFISWNVRRKRWAWAASCTGTASAFKNACCQIPIQDLVFNWTHHLIQCSRLVACTVCVCVY